MLTKMAKNIVKSIIIKFLAENSLKTLDKIREVVCNILVTVIIFSKGNDPDVLI